MKTYLLIFIFCCSSSSFTLAQTKGYNEWGIGYGYNYTRAYVGSDLRAKQRGGINVGISVDHYLSPKWSIKAKLQYDMKGWDSTGYNPNKPITETAINTEHRLHYLTVPLLAKWHLGKARSYYTHFGPYTAVLFDGKMISKKSVSNAGLTDMEVGLLMGFGGYLPIKDKLRLFIECNFSGSLTDVKKAADGNGYRNSVTALTFGFNF